MIRLDEIASGKASIREWASLFSGKYFAMIVVYADETGTHGLKKGGKEPAPGIYGFMATPEQWEYFRSIWSAALKKYDVDYFHFRDLLPQQRNNPRKPYYGWSDTKTDDFIHDMAVVASSGPIPIGGYVSIKRLYSGRTDKEAHAGSYQQAFEQFFDNFSSSMDDHFPGSKEQVSFFFDENKNEEWIGILNSAIKKERKRDPRIGEYTQIDDKTYRGMPCQAADLFAFANRQVTQTIFESDSYVPQRLLDFIIARHALEPNCPLAKFYAQFSNEEWLALVQSLRACKKLKESRDVILGLPEEQFYPFRHHPFLKAKYKALAMEMLKYENKQRV
jgi:hypothetical protein